MNADHVAIVWLADAETESIDPGYYYRFADGLPDADLHGPFDTADAALTDAHAKRSADAR